MINQTPECHEAVGPVSRNRRWEYASLGAVCALVIGVYAWSVQSGLQESAGVDPIHSYYNLLVQGFRAGQLDLKKAAPAGLAQLANPYDPEANAAYRLQDTLLDLSYYRGKLYLYFGVTPAVVLFWPWHELTGQYLRHRDAVLIFCTVGFLAGAGLVVAMGRRDYANLGVGVVAAGVVAMGLASGTPLLLARADVCRVPISCGYALTMVSLWLLWVGLHGKGRGGWWLAGASVAYGLAVGARPSLLFGAAVLLVPVLQSVKCRVSSDRTIAAGLCRFLPRVTCPSSRFGPWLLAAIAPLVLIGVGLMIYNYLRFDSLFGFGWRQQLGAFRQDVGQAFSLDYFWFNFRVYFREPVQWSLQFPFMHGIAALRLPAKYAVVEDAFGVLTNLPVLWLALAAPLAWRGRSGDSRSGLQWFGSGVVGLFGICALTLCLFWAAVARYEVEFLSPLVLLAVMGIFGLERAMSSRGVWSWVIRGGWGVLLVWSVAFILFARHGFYSETGCDLGLDALQRGRVDEATAHFQKALAQQPANARARNSLGAVLFQQGKVSEAITQYETAVRLKPDYAEAQHNLGTALLQLGRAKEALSHLEQGVRLKPGVAEAHNNLATALAQLGRIPEAVQQYEQALRIEPQHADTHYNFGKLLLRLGKAEAAIPHYEQVLKANPTQARAHRDIAVALFGLGRVAEAEDHLKRAVQFNPADADAHFNLGLVLSHQGELAGAAGHYEQVLRLNPTDYTVQNKLAWLLATGADASVRNGARAIELAREADQLSGGKDAGIQDTLAAAYAEAGRFDDAVRTTQTALELANGAGQAEQAKQIAERLRIYQTGQPYREGGRGTP